MVSVKGRSAWGTWRTAFEFVRWMVLADSRHFAVYVLLMIVSGILPAVSVWVSMHVFTSAVQVAHSVSGEDPLVLWISVWAVIAFLSNLLWSVYQLAQERLRMNLEATLERSLQDKASKLPLENFERPDFYDLLERARGNSQPGEFINLLMELWCIGQAGIQTLTIAGVIAAWNRWMVAALLLVAVMDSIAQWSLAREVHDTRVDLAANDRERKYLHRILTTPNAAKEVRMLNVGEHFLKRWALLDKQATRVEFGMERKRSIVRGPLAASSMLSLAFGIGMAAWQTVHGRLAAGMFAATLYGLQQFQVGLETSIGRVGYLRQYLLRITDLFDYLELEPENQNGGESLSPEDVGSLEARGVSFRYPQSNEWAVRDVSFHLSAGERVAIVGENGAGKSTLVRLLIGLYRPADGIVLCGGTDLQHLDRMRFLESTSAVFQDFVRYAFTLRENIGLGDVQRMSDLAAIQSAAKAGGVDSFALSLPRGYDTTMTTTFQGGIDLSGGQWQKVAISRAFMRNAALAVLDEPTAALDPNAETEVLKRFLELSGGKTAIIVSHRLGVARLCDRVIVMKDGSIVETGSHDELVAQAGEYARMWVSQSQWYVQS